MQIISLNDINSCYNLKTKPNQTLDDDDDDDYDYDYDYNYDYDDDELMFDKQTNNKKR